MEAFGVNEIWLLATAAVFTVVGWYFGYKSNSKVAVEHTIDTLIEQGYIKSRKNADGSIEILKHYEK